MPRPISYFIFLCCSTLFPYTTLFRSAFDADPKFFACLVRFESSSVPTTLPTAYDVYPLDGRHDGGYYTVKDCVTIDGIITTIMATIQRINKIGRAVQQECRDRSRISSFSVVLHSFPTRRSSDLLLMPTLNFLPVWFALSLLRFRLPSRLPMMFILWMVAMMVVIIPSRTV